MHCMVLWVAKNKGISLENYHSKLRTKTLIYYCCMLLLLIDQFRNFAEA